MSKRPLGSAKASRSGASSGRAGASAAKAPRAAVGKAVRRSVGRTPVKAVRKVDASGPATPASSSPRNLAEVIAEVVADAGRPTLRSFAPEPVPGSFGVPSPWSSPGRMPLAEVVGPEAARRFLGEMAARAALVFRAHDVFAEIVLGEALTSVHVLDPASCLLHPLHVATLVDAYVAEGASVILLDRDDVPADLTGRWDDLRKRLPSVRLSASVSRSGAA